MPSTIVLPVPRSSKRHETALAWLSKLCLDAPIVAVLWQLLLVRSFDLIPGRAASVWLFLTAWMIYLADRVADSYGITAGMPTSARQRFCLEHRRTFIAAIVLLAFADASIAFIALESRIFSLGLIVGGVTLCYLACNYLACWLWRALPIKEITIGFLFAAGTVLASGAHFAAILPVYLALGLLCSLNCLSISFWERPLDQGQGRCSFATEHRTLRRWPEYFSSFLAVSFLVAVAIFPWRLAAALFISSVFLALLNRTKKFDPDGRVSLADVALFTPILFLFG